MDTEARKDELARNLERVRSELNEAERAAGREAGSVALMPVTKFHDVSAIEILGELGVTLVGENREQEARAKAEHLAAADETASGETASVGIAMLGQIQSKKANAVARWAREVHSVDSVKLAHGLDRGMALALERGNRESDTLPCFIQYSFDGDPARGGVQRDAVAALAEEIVAAEHLELTGIMVVPPLESDAEAVFRDSRALADELGETFGRPLLLSAGMSQDFSLAIQCGSDIVRVGTALLGARPVR